MSTNEVASQLWGTLKDNGFSDESAAGVIANAQSESGLNPTIYGCNSAYGLFQFDPNGALPGFKSYCSKNNYQMSSASVQTKYMLTRLGSAFNSCTGKTYTYPNGTVTWWPEKMTLAQFKKKTGGADGAALCAEIFCRVYERPSIPHMDTRKSNARSWYSKFAGTSGDGSGVINDSDDNSTSYNPYAFQYTLKGSIFDPEVVRSTVGTSTTKTSTSKSKTESKSSTKVTYPITIVKNLGKVTYVTIQYSSKTKIGTAFNKSRHTNTSKWATIHNLLNKKENVWIGIDKDGDLHHSTKSKVKLKEIIDAANKKITGKWYVCGYNKDISFDAKTKSSKDNTNSYYYEKICTAQNSGKKTWIGIDDNGGLHYSTTSEDTMQSYVDKANGKIPIPGKDDGAGDETTEPTGENVLTELEATSTGVKYTSLKSSNMIDNYIYLYHEDVFIVLPTFVESLTDTMSVSFASTQPLGRSAPIYSYTGSGPRSLQFTFDLHRDMMTDINYKTSNAKVTLSDDYVDTMINYLQAMAVPKYTSSNKTVNPPMVAVRMGDDIFIKGIISGAVSITYKLPILRNNKYSNVSVSFTVDEVDPYSAGKIMKMGSLRGISTQLESKIWG